MNELNNVVYRLTQLRQATAKKLQQIEAALTGLGHPVAATRDSGAHARKPSQPKSNPAKYAPVIRSSQVVAAAKTQPRTKTGKPGKSGKKNQSGKKKW